MAFVAILLLASLSGGYGVPFSSKFQMMRGYLNNYTVEDVQRREDLEYPRNNQRILKVLKQLWETYYECLRKNAGKERKPEMRRLLEGQYTELECDICPRPFQDYEEIQWKYKPLTPNREVDDLEYLDLTPDMIYMENKTIRIFNAGESLSGLYVCYQKTNVVSVYVLEVSRNDTTERVETLQVKPELKVHIEGRNYRVSYQWSQWTECSACGRVGRQFRYGTCHVVPTRESKSRKAHRRSFADTYAGDIIAKMRDKVTDQNTTAEDAAAPSWDAVLLDKFSTGIPCASGYFPRSVLETVHNLKAVKVFVRYCREECQETEIFEVFDDAGRLVEWANNTAGIYSMFQKIPQQPHDIERRTVAADFGTDITIQCPGTTFANIPVTWKINKKIVFPDIVANESDGRFTIDLVNRINLKKLRLKDSRTYSCWQRGKLVGTVNLNVEKKFKLHFDHHVTLVGIIAVTGTFLLVGAKVLARELKMRKK